MPSEPVPTPPHARSSRGERIAWVFLTLLAPGVLAWTSWCFWRLFTTGKLWVRDGTSVYETDGGLHFWTTLGLYLVLWCGALVLLLVAISPGRARRRR